MADNLIYGPVPSRRLGFSLGVDLVPYKVCSYSCIYCQIGTTPETTTERKPYVPSEIILSQLFARLNEGIHLPLSVLAAFVELASNVGVGSWIHVPEA